MPFMWRRASRNTDLQDAKTGNRGRILDDDAFDDLARTIASGTTRRDSLKLLLVGITSAGVGAGLIENSSQGHAAPARRGPNQVETLTIITGSCHFPITTGPSCQAITSFSQLGSCEGVLQQGFAGDFNGCGSQGFHVSGRFAGGVNVTQCCNNHDCCYSTCGASKSECDTDFLACMQILCGEGRSPRICREEADAFYELVQFFGETAYKEAQVAACVCCCPDQETRCNGVCVDTQTDPNHCGGCTGCQPGEQCFQGGCVSGNGSASDLILSPGTLEDTGNGLNIYEYLFSAGTQTFTITNTGPDSSPTLDLSLSLSPGLPTGLIVLSNDTCSGTSLTVGGSCTFDMSFPPPANVCPGGSSMVFVQGGGETFIDLRTDPNC